jgi:exodeoxyribonuclease-3
VIRLATWNVNSVRARLPVVLEWLREARPDIVLLQETKVQDAAFPRDPFADEGYNIALFGQKTYNGVAILSKFPLDDVVCGFPALGEEQEARYIEAFTGGVRVASVYVTNGQAPDSPKYERKRQFFEALRGRAQTLLIYGEALILGGDYNVAPTDADVYDPQAWHEKILCSTPERAWLQSLMDLGFTDALASQVLPSGKRPFTWWDYRGNGFPRNAGLRIDHLLLSESARTCLHEVEVQSVWRAQEKTSDHAPVMGVFRRPVS